MNPDVAGTIIREATALANGSATPALVTALYAESDALKAITLAVAVGIKTALEVNAAAATPDAAYL